MRCLSCGDWSTRIALGHLPRILVVQNLQQEVRMHSNEKPAGWQRKLRFEDEEIWTVLPESVREQCLTLWRQVLASVLKTDKGRQNEREG
jgi:hypothetical protein